MYEKEGYEAHDSWSYRGLDDFGVQFVYRGLWLSQYETDWALTVDEDEVGHVVSDLQARVLLTMPADEVYEKYFGRGR